MIWKIGLLLGGGWYAYHRLQSPRLVDANTGIEPVLGQPFDNVIGRVTVHDVVWGGPSGAQGLISVNGSEPSWQPLVLRWTHPRFPLLRPVAFIPS